MSCTTTVGLTQEGKLALNALLGIMKLRESGNRIGDLLDDGKPNASFKG